MDCSSFLNTFSLNAFSSRPHGIMPHPPTIKYAQGISVDICSLEKLFEIVS